MLPDPLHPAVVHFPIALAALIPLLALLSLLAIARSWLPVRTWAAIVLLQALLVGSAWLALETGEEQEERVERIVAERHIEDHEEAAEYLLPLAARGAGTGGSRVAAGPARNARTCRRQRGGTRRARCCGPHRTHWRRAGVPARRGAGLRRARGGGCAPALGV